MYTIIPLTLSMAATLLDSFTQGEWTLTVYGDARRPMFLASEIAAHLSIDNTSKLMKPLPEDCKELRRVNTAGGAQDKWLVTEAGLYRLVLRSNKSQAEAFRVWVTEVLVKIRDQGFYCLQQEAADASAAHLHAALMRAFATMNCVYLAEVADGVLKVGHSTDLPRREGEQRGAFGRFSLVHCCQVHNYFQFERWLIKHPEVARRRVAEVAGVFSRECFRPDSTFGVSHMVELMEASKRDFNDTKPDEVRLERDRVQMERERLQTQQLQTLLEMQRLHYANVRDIPLPAGLLPGDGPAPDASAVPPMPTLLVTGLPSTRRVQQYTESGVYMTTHESIACAAKSAGTFPSFIRESHDKDVLTKGYRWRVLDKDATDTPQDLAPLSKSTKRRSGLVAQLDGLKETILSVHSNAQAASVAAGCSNDSILRAIRLGCHRDGCFWTDWERTTADMQATYITQHGPISASPSNNAKAVIQLDKDTRDPVGAPGSMQEAATRLQTSHKSLKQAITGDRVLRGYRWAWNVVPH